MRGIGNIYHYAEIIFKIPGLKTRLMNANNHLVNYNKNKTFTLKPDHLNDDSQIEARLHFKAKKHLT